MQQVESLCRQLPAEKVGPRQVASRPGEAGDEAEPDRVLGGNKGDRDRRGCRLGSDRRGGCGRGDYSDPPANQFGRQFRQSIELVLGETIDDCYVLTLQILLQKSPIGKAIAPWRGVRALVAARSAEAMALKRLR